MRRRVVLHGGVVAAVGLTGCLSQFTGQGSQQFKPAVESFNGGLETFSTAQSERTAARQQFDSERWAAAATGYATARDGFDAAAREFRDARDATSGSCPAVHDRAQRQYRRALALVEACTHWTAAATAHETADSGTAKREIERARVWDGRAADYPTTTRLDPDQFSCRT